MSELVRLHQPGVRPTVSYCSLFGGRISGMVHR
jgi:hypothetical protein